jgi:MFS family permease
MVSLFMGLPTWILACGGGACPARWRLQQGIRVSAYACTALGTLCLLGIEIWRYQAPLYAYALFFGLGFGARGPIITAMASQLFQGKRFGVIYGILSIGNGIGGGIGPWFGGAIHDVTGSYQAAFLITIVFCALGTACFWLARPPHTP